MQKLGQHFLKNETVIKKIIAALDLSANDSVIEIGPGHGELTIPLSLACAAAGASLSVIEKDPKLAEALRGKLTGVNIILGDALVLLPQAIAEGKQPPASKACKLVGNIPYYITGKLLRTISELEQKPERSIFMVQEEVAERIVAAPPFMNRLAASVQFWADAEIIAHVPKSDFSPPPKIDSAVITLKKTAARPRPLEQASIEPANYYATMHAVFAQPRKTILNNIAAIMNEGTPPRTPKTEIIARLKKIGVNPEARPQNLSTEQIIAIAESLPWG